MSPDLAMIGAYDLPQFKTLLSTWRPAGGQKLKLMASIARPDLSHMTDAEIERLHAYLIAPAQRLSK